MSNLPEDLIEDALRTYPLAEVPAGFSKTILEKIKPVRPHAALKFRLTWLDYALGLFLSMLPAVAFVSWAFLPRQVLLRLQYQWLWFNSPVFEPFITACLLAATLLLGISLVLGVRWLTRPSFASL
jgi:pheromone shutdown protein TraB